MCSGLCFSRITGLKAITKLLFEISNFESTHFLNLHVPKMLFLSRSRAFPLVKSFLHLANLLSAFLFPKRVTLTLIYRKEILKTSALDDPFVAACTVY